MVANWWEKQTMWPSESNTAKAAWQAAQEEFKKQLDDELTAAFMLGYDAAKNDYGRKE